MRLLLIANNFPTPHQPTRGIFNLGMARALARSHDVRVICPIPWVDEYLARRRGAAALPASRAAEVEGIEVHYPRFFYAPKILREQHGTFLWQSTRGTVRRLLASRTPDVVLGYWVHPDGEVAVRAARQAGVPAVVMTGGSDVLVLSKDERRRRRVEGVLRSADAVVAVSRDLKAKVLDFGVDPGKVHVVPRGVDRDRFSPGDRAEARRRLGIPAQGRAIVWVGRMVPVKGLDVLLEACTRLRARGVDFRLDLVGDGPLRPALESESRARGLEEVVRFAGSQPHDRLPDWYRAADFAVLPSRSEGSPNVLRECLACGTPFVASRVGGIPELAEDPARQLVPPGDPAALAEAIGRGFREGLPVGPPRSEGLEASARALAGILGPLVAAPGRDRGPAIEGVAPGARRA